MATTELQSVGIDSQHADSVDISVFHKSSGTIAAQAAANFGVFPQGAGQVCRMAQRDNCQGSAVDSE